MAEQKPANENPLYVLMTLHGEQLSDKVDWELADRNIELWNIWACQHLSAEQRNSLLEAGVPVPAENAWAARKAQVETLYKHQWRLRNGNDFAPPDLPSSNRPYDLTHIVFYKAVALKNAIFPELVHFTSARFCCRTFFSSACFAKDVFSDETEFVGDVFFYDSIFSQRAFFSKALFRGSAYFSSGVFEDDASFDFVTFEGEANYSGTKLKRKAGFGSAKFKEKAWFYSTLFLQTADFGKVSIVEDAHFRSATFTQDVSFDAATFSGFANFVGTSFGNGEAHGQRCQPSFDDAVFEKPTSFRGAVFRHHYPQLAGTVFHEKTQLTAKPKNWPKARQAVPEDAKEACATLRHIVAKQSLPEDEYFFFRREMRFAGQSGPILSRLVYKAYGAVSNYGYSIGRPVFWLVLLWLIAVPFYLGCSLEEVGCLFVEPAAPLLPVDKAMGFSGSNMFKFLGFQRTYFGDELDLIKQAKPWLQNLAAAQTVLGYILLFFLGLGLRARFRLR